jgi:uncharacterized OB-fold protein
MRQCHRCGKLVEPPLLICPKCRRPLYTTTKPILKRWRVRFVVTVLVVIAVAVLLWLRRL